MNIVKPDIEGVLIIKSRLFRVSCGYFFENFSEREFEENDAECDAEDLPSFPSHPIRRFSQNGSSQQKEERSSSLRGIREDGTGNS